MFGWFQKKDTPPTSDDLSTERATEFFSRGDYREALRRAEAIIEQAPQVGLSWRFRGECLFEMGRFIEAADCFREAEARGGPGVEEMFLWQALALHNGERTDEAKNVIRFFLEKKAAEWPDLVPKAKNALKMFDKASREAQKPKHNQEPPPLVIAPDDPLMLNARTQARATVDELRTYFARFPRTCSAKVPFLTDGGRTEHVWSQILALGSSALRVSLVNRPLTHKGRIPGEVEVQLDQIDDWEVTLPDGKIGGGYTTRVMFIRAQEQWGKLPAEMAEHQTRYLELE
jgi:uncharacterized protein YegJ (DUF2314 family)